MEKREKPKGFDTGAATERHWQLQGLIDKLGGDEYQSVREAYEALAREHPYAFYLRVWVDYAEAKQWRLKCLHDIRLKDGRQFDCMYPNADSWCGVLSGGNAQFKDDQVAYIRISAKQLGD